MEVDLVEELLASQSVDFVGAPFEAVALQRFLVVPS